MGCGRFDNSCRNCASLFRPTCLTSDIDERSAVSFDQKEFRNACGSFATGITIVTTTGPGDEPIGMTVNSFSSLSLDPPLVMWAVGSDAISHDIFSQTDHFAIHILHKDQEGLSNLFASRGEDKFSSLDWTPGAAGSPVLPDYAVCLQCKTENVYPGGDHNILVGRVIALDDRGTEQPILFYKGRYANLA